MDFGERLRRQRERQKGNRFRIAKQQLCTCITLFCIFLCSQVSFSYPSPSLLLKLPNIAFYSGHAIRPAVGTLYLYNITRKKLQGKRNCFRKELNFKKNHMYTLLVFRIDSPLKNNFLLNIFISCFDHPESASEVSAECEFPAHLIKYQ